MRFIFVTGGVISSLGKGIAAASVGALLIEHGFKIHIRKLEPYINVDPGTINPFEHGEVFVTEDGAETDLDLGHYERFTGITTTKFDAVSTGQIYKTVIDRERKGGYLGKTIQVVPHITDEIKNVICENLPPYIDFLICEIGGTVGDIESRAHFEAIRQLAYDKGRENVIFIHLTLLPFIAASGELKTKPSQHSVQTLLSFGIQADMLLCRTSFIIEDDNKRKLASFCNIKIDNVIEALDVSHINNVVINFNKRGLDKQILQYFSIPYKKIFLEKWHKSVENYNKCENVIDVAIVGKYTKLKDTYKSLNEAILHGATRENYVLSRVNISYIDSEEINEENINEKLKKFSGIVVAGGFGSRGVFGKLSTISYCKNNNIPILGICLGFQLMCVEELLSLNFPDVNSTEFDKNCATPVIHIINENDNLGGTMRLGLFSCEIEEGSFLHKIYGETSVLERHRHRYEVNEKYISDLETGNLKICGKHILENGFLVEAVERKTHKFFVGVQYHAEFSSKIHKPHPLFCAFIEACL